MQDIHRVSAWLAVLENKINRYGNRLLKEADLTVMQLRVLKYLKMHPRWRSSVWRQADSL